MGNRFLLVAAAAAAFAVVPATAHAQDSENESEFFVGVSAGYHDLGFEPDATIQVQGIEIHDSSPILGVFAGMDFPLGESMFAGVEGNFHLGTDVIDSEYGASGRLGFRSDGGAKFYVRGGYQEVDVDPYKLVTFDSPIPAGALDDVDDTLGDWMVGAGADFPVGDSYLRVNLDTISFDTLRATAGFAFAF